MQRRKYALIKRPSLDNLGDTSLASETVGDVLYFDGTNWINTNLAELVGDAVSSLLVAGNNIDLTYDDGANSLTVDVEVLTTADISDLASYTGLDVRYYTETEIDTTLGNYVLKTTTLTAGEGLTGGGDLSANRSFALDVNGLTAEASVDSAADYFVMYDASAGAHRKVLGSNLPGGGSGDVATDAIWDAKGDLAAGTGANTASRLAIGTDGQVLTADSAEATGMKWATPSGGVSDGDKGDITVSASGATWTIDAGVVTYAKMQDVSATSRILGRKTAGAGDTEECTLSEILDFIGSAAQGDILYRGASGWERLGAGTSGHYLQTQGAAANPQWAAASGGASTIYGSMFFHSRPYDAQLMWQWTAPVACTIPADMSGAYGDIGTNPTATVSLALKQNGTQIGTISISTSGVFTFTTTSGTSKSISAGDKLTIENQGTTDTTAADFSVTIPATL